MNWIENLLIIGGVSLDIFATMESQGSLVAKIEKRGLAFICGFVCLWQTAAFGAGISFSSLLMQKDKLAGYEAFIGSVATGMIFAGLGIHLLIKVVRNETINEHREENFNRKRILCGMAGTGRYIFLSGIAIGIVGFNRIFCLLAIIVFSVLAVIGGTYTGYHFGFEQWRKVYGAGALLLWIVGVDVLARMFF